jgi:hypothetical protein
MRPTDDIEKLVKQMYFKAGSEMDNDLWADAARAHDEFQKTKWVRNRPFIRRMTMNTKTMKITVIAIIALAVLLPLSYGAAKIIQSYRVERTATIKVKAAEGFDEKKAQEALEYAKKVIEKGEAEEIRPGIYRVTLPDGEVVELGTTTSGSLDDMPPKMRAILEEVEKLREAGDFKDTLIDEYTKDDGTKVSIYEEVYTLSNGDTQKFTRKEEIKETENGKKKQVYRSVSKETEEQP